MKIMDIKIKVGVIIVKQNKILLIKEKIKSVEKHKWNIIKGTLEDLIQEDVFEAAIRECKEEASVDVKLINLLGVFISRNNQKIRIQFNFTAEIINNSPAVPDKKNQKLRNEDIIEVKWFSKNQLEKMQKNEFLTKEAYSTIQNWTNGVKHPLDCLINFD